MTSLKNEALIFGASGLIGWAVVNQTLSGYPQSGTFSKVTAVVNRSLDESDFHWPALSPERPKLRIISGIDLFNSSAEGLAMSLRDKLNDAGNITHVFYFVFKPMENDVEEAKTNCAMMGKVAYAMNQLSPRLKSFVYSGGTRGYGIYDPNGIFSPPLEESMAECLPEDYKKTVAYPFYRSLLSKACEGKDWNWTEVCPDAVVGFTPNGSAFSLALHWAQYLSLLAHKSDTGTSAGGLILKKRIPFPGNMATWNAKFTPVSSQTLGRASIYAALNPNLCGGKIINVADNHQPICFGEIWPSLAAWFGLEGVEPDESSETALKPGEYVAQYKHLFDKAGRPKAEIAGVGDGAKQLDSVGWWLGFDRQLSLDRLRVVGFTEEINPVAGWLEAFQKFRESGIII